MPVLDRMMHNAAEYNEHISISHSFSESSVSLRILLPEGEILCYGHKHVAIPLDRLKTASLGTHPQTKIKRDYFFYMDNI